MPQAKVTIQVRVIDPTSSVIDIQGEVSSFAEQPLMAAYAQAAGPATSRIVLNFTALDYMNSSGIGLLVTLLIRVNRQKQRLLAYGLSEHYRHIFTLTRISDAIHIFDSEVEALAG